MSLILLGHAINIYAMVEIHVFVHDVDKVHE